MTKTIFNINFNYTFNADHKGAPYTLDGSHYMNNGEFLETASKICLGYEGKKDANTRYDMGSDIEELNCSVKSGKATLASNLNGNNFAECEKTYFENVHSTLWAWAVKVDEQIFIYFMNKDEFQAFMRKWAGYYADRKTIRFKATSGKMLNWLDEMVA